MKKSFFITIICFMLIVLLLQSASVDWKDYLKASLNRTIDTVEDIYLHFKVIDPQLYKSFKQESDSLQRSINEYLNAYGQQNSSQDLGHAHEFYMKLRQEQQKMLEQAKNQLDPKDFDYLRSEVEHLNQLLKKIAKDLHISTDEDENVRVQAVQVDQDESDDSDKTGENTQTMQAILKDVAQEVKGRIFDLTRQYATRKALNTFNTLEFNPTRSSQATVVDRKLDLAPNEKMLIDSPKNMGKRLGNVAQAQQKLFLEKVSKADALRIGVVFSGGGYRAMIMSLGYATGLAKMGIWDAASYVSTLSGSTWFLTVLMHIASSHKGLNSVDILSKTFQHFVNKIQLNTFSLATPPKVSNAMKNFIKKEVFLSFINNTIWPKFLFQRPFRSVDIYGGLLAETLLSDLGQDPQILRLSNEWEAIKDGNWPLPIRTAVTMTRENGDNYKYHWFEFNPIEVRDIETDLAISTYAFGRLFSDGVSVNQAVEQKKIAEYGPEERLGYLMGVWGSAYTANLKDLLAMMKEFSQNVTDRARATVVAELLNALEQDPPIGKKRLSPAQVNNPFKTCQEDRCPRSLSSEEKDYLTFIDAGIDFNLALPPLFKEQRQLDVIIVADSSSDIAAPTQLNSFFKYIKEKGIEYKRIDDRKNTTLGIWRSLDDEKAPLIIYINFKNDQGLLKSARSDLNLKALIDNYKLDEFDYKKALAGSANTFNFDYKLDDFQQIFGIAEFNMRANQKVIMNLLRERWDKKRSNQATEEIVFGEWEN